jgi:phage-related protein (TIGR01555 family)
MWFKKEIKEQPEKTSMWDAIDSVNIPSAEDIYQKGYSSSFQKVPTASSSGMDSACLDTAFGQSTQYGINPYVYNWYASQAFIGYQTMAVIAQNGMISKCCNLPVKDAIRKGWEVYTNNEEIDPEVYEYIQELDKHKFNIKKKLVNQGQFTKVFGIRIALFDIQSTDPEFYEKPFNIDGVAPKAYKGIKQVDPYWCTPVLEHENSTDSANLNFYEPTYWMINGRRYHKSHLVITTGDEVADILKPTYQYGGISLTQKIYERLYGAERTANEVPMLVQSKRTNVYKMPGVSEVMGQFNKFTEKMKKWITLRDNYGMRFIDSEDSIEQIETSLADLDVNIMTQFQLVCSIANIPSYKLLNAPMKGFSSGETEEASYHEELENIQDYTLTPLLDRHYLLLAKSEIEPKFGINPHFGVKWNEVNSVSEKERAEIDEINSRTDMNYINMGVLSQDHIQEKITKDENSRYDGMSFEDDYEIEDPTEEILNFEDKKIKAQDEIQKDLLRDAQDTINKREKEFIEKLDSELDI